jgi:hypothetical protein
MTARAVVPMADPLTKTVGQMARAAADHLLSFVLRTPAARAVLAGVAVLARAGVSAEMAPGFAL